MQDFSNLLSEDLARACDEYIRRAISTASDNGVTDPVTITIIASRYNLDNDYEIKHRVSIGHYGRESVIEGNNCIRAVSKLSNRWEDDRHEKPTQVQQLLAAPVSQRLMKIGRSDD